MTKLIDFDSFVIEYGICEIGATRVAEHDEHRVVARLPIEPYTARACDVWQTIVLIKGDSEITMNTVPCEGKTYAGFSEPCEIEHTPYHRYRLFP